MTTSLCPPHTEGRDPTRDKAAPCPAASHGAGGQGQRYCTAHHLGGDRFLRFYMQGWKKAGDEDSTELQQSEL